MMKMKRFVSLVLLLSIALTLIPAKSIAQNEASPVNKAGNTLFSDTLHTFKNPVAYQSLPALSTVSEADIFINNPSAIAYDTRVTYEIVTEGRIGITAADTQSAVIHFTIENPGEQLVSFDYSVVTGSVESSYLTGTLSGTVSLSKDAPQKDITIDMKPFANNPEDFNTSNNSNAFWSGKQFFYLYCNNIQNAIFGGERESLTVPVPVESGFDYQAAYENAVNARLIDLNNVAGGADGVYPVPEGGELRLSGEISGDVRKMLDAGVLTHILLPQGYFVNESDEVQDVTYHIKAMNDKFSPPIEAYKFVSQNISLAAASQTPLYSGDFTQEVPIGEINLGPHFEGNTIFNRVDFIFERPAATTPVAASFCFLDDAGQYLQHQVSFSDKAAPEVRGVLAGMLNARYGDDIPVVITFSEPVYTGGITFKVNGQTLNPMESTGTISQRVSFLYRIGDEALDVNNFAVELTDITGAADLSRKAQEGSGRGSASVAVSFDPKHAFAYCAEPSVILDQGTSRNVSASVSISIKKDTALSNWLNARKEGENISTAVKAKAITTGGALDLPLTIQTDGTRVTALRGSFTVPENNTGNDVLYLLEIYLDAGGGYEPVYSLAVVYAVQPLILVDNESDISLNYTNWPSGDRIFINAGSSLSLGYLLNVDATWIGPKYFKWSSSDVSIAEINEDGVITLKSTGEVYFTLTVTNPLSEDAALFKSRKLTILESQDAYLYVPNGIKNQDLLSGSEAKISFTSNLAERNDLYGGAGTKTLYTFNLYELDDDGTKKGSPLSTEVIDAAVQAPLNFYTVPASMLTKITEKNRYGYTLEISAKDMNSGVTLIAGANIRIRQLPAKASLIRPDSVFMLDNATSFTVSFDIENKTSETEYSLTVTKNSESIPVATVSSPVPIEPQTVNIAEVGTSRLLDVYTVSLKAKNISDEAWSYDSYSIYVYNRAAMKMLLDGFPAPGSLTMGYDFNDGDIIHNIDFLKYRSMIGKELMRTVKIDDRAYAWSAIADRVSWKTEGESVSLWYDNRRIGGDYNPALLPGTSLLLKGDGAGRSVVTATHTLTGMTGSMNIVLEPLNDRLFLFRLHQNVPCELTYTNGNGQEKTVTFSGEVGVYEESGIKSDVVFYPTNGAENIFDYTVISLNTLKSNQKRAGSFDLYPINTVRLPDMNYSVSLELYGEISGLPYTGDIIIRGGVYFNDVYQRTTTINGKAGNADQTVSADEKGRYILAFRPSDFTGRLLASDKLRYVIEVSFTDNSHRTQYITVENDDIKAYKGSPLGVCLKEGVRPLDASSIQNKAVVISQTLTIDGEEQSILDRICLDTYPKSAVLDMTVSVPQYSNNYYKLAIFHSSGRKEAESGLGEIVNAYPFSASVTLHFSFDIHRMLLYGGYWSEDYKPGQIIHYYPAIRSADQHQEIRLSKLLEVQNLQNMPKMETLDRRGGDLANIEALLWEASDASKDNSYDGDSDAVKDALEMLENYSLDTASFGLEVTSTNDPLVYKGIIRFAVGSYSKDNPSGVFIGSGEKKSFNFMPGFSDVKAMAKGTFLKEAKKAMNDSRKFYKTYGGGAYIDCVIYYSMDEEKWKISLVYGDFYLGGGGTYRRNYNGWVSFVPVTSTFKFNMTAEVGLTILNSQVRNETAYIPRLRPLFSIYGFGGVGFDYTFVAFKAGGYGFVEHEQNYLWYTDNNGLKMDGQQLKISGEVGVEYAIWLAFVKLSGKYVLADFTKSWEFNDYKRIQDKIAANKRERSKMGFPAPGVFPGSEDAQMMVLVPVEESVAFEDRSYLKDYERSWGPLPSGRRMYALSSAEELTDIWINAYPNASPQLSYDGELIVYLSDMESEDLSDTTVLFAVKDGTGTFPTEGTEIDASDYPDSMPFLSGTKDSASAAWVRCFADIAGEAGSTATMEDVIKGLAASEVMTGVYKDGAFTPSRLTNNDNPDLSPVTAASENKAITAWRSVTLGDMDNPLDFTSDYIMYSVYNGSGWSGAKYLYDGSINKVRAFNTAMLPDGTSAIVYQIAEAGADSETLCAVLDTDGKVVRTLRLTDNMTEDANPQIIAVKFPDGAERFVTGWNAETDSGKSTLQMVAVNADGTLYPELSLELPGSTGSTEYSKFRFAKGASRLEDLSVIWSEPEDADKDGIYEYSIFGTRLLVSDEGGVSATGKQKLLALNEGRTPDSIDTRVDTDTEKVHFVMLLSEPGGLSTLTTAVSEYKNIFTVKELYYEYEDLLPGLDMPVMFTIKNDGIDSISRITITLGGQSFEYEGEALAPGEEKSYLISYPVPNPVTDADFTVTAQYGDSGETSIQTGALKLYLPDVGIYQIDCTRETHRERSFRALLQNTAFADLKKDIHTVKLEVWDHPDFTEGLPLRTLTVSGDDFGIINDSLLSVDVTLTEEDLQWILDENGEIPEGGVRLIFRVVLAEGGKIIEDADISNDMDFVSVYSLIEKNGTAVSLASLAEAAEGKTKVQIEAINNSMNIVNNGNIIVTLRDENGNVLETQQTYNPSDSSSLLNIPGEESETVSVLFNRTGYTTDVTFARASGESTLLSVLNLTGVPVKFDQNVFEYNLQTYDLIETNLTAVAENPASIISVTRNGLPVSMSSPISMAYGTNVFVISVTTGETGKTYTVTVKNNRLDDDTNGGDPITSDKPESGDSIHYNAGLTMEGIKQRDLTISLRNGRAVVSLGSSAQEIFFGDTEAALAIPTIPGVEGYSLEVPAHALTGSYTGAAVTVNTELGSVRIPAGMLAGKADLEGRTAGIHIAGADKSRLPADIRAIVGDRPILSLTLTLDGKQTDWSNANTPILVRIPYTPTAEELKNPESIVIWYIDGSGRAVSVPNGRYDPDSGTVTFNTTHFSNFAVVYHPVLFNDVASSAWYNKPVSFIAARGITYGTGNGEYSPEATLTRGEFIVLIMRAYDIKPDMNPVDNFSDAGSNYYTGYLAAAKRLGISTGVGNNMFAPDKAITRQEMFTLLCNALRAIKQLPEMRNPNETGRSKSLSDFTDERQIASWAREAMLLLVESGIVNGSTGKLTPAGITTRAQMAQVLYNLMR